MVDFELTDEQQLIRKTAREFTDSEIVEQAKQNARNHHFDLEIVRKLGAQGYLGAIGRRYRRQDEIGTPFCFTIDHQSLEDRTATLRDRDSLAQERLPIEEIPDEVERRLAAPWKTPKQ